MNSFETIEMLNSIIENINNSSIELTKQLSSYDLQQQDILHFIENSKLNAVQISKLMRMLKSIRNNRRVVKNEFHRYQSLASKLSNGSNLLETTIATKKEEDYYEFKTNILLDDFGFDVGSKMYFDPVKKVEFNTSVAREVEEDIVHVEYVKRPIEKEIEDSDIDISTIMSHPEGQKIILTDIKTGVKIQCNNFEKAVVRAIGGVALTKLKPVDLIKNVSGAMKALKFGNSYLGYKWVVE